jgi:hypothetical protein
MASVMVGSVDGQTKWHLTEVPVVPALSRHRRGFMIDIYSRDPYHLAQAKLVKVDCH